MTEAAPPEAGRGLALAGALFALLFVPLSIAADHELRALTASRIAEVIGSAATVGELHTSILGVTLESVDSAPVSLGRVEVDVSLLGLVSGAQRVERVQLDRVVVRAATATLSAQHIELGRRSDGWHARCAQLGIAVTGTAAFELELDELAVDLVGRQPRRAAFRGGTLRQAWLGTLGGLTGQLQRKDALLSGRISRPHLDAELSVELDGGLRAVDLHLKLDHDPLEKAGLVGALLASQGSSVATVGGELDVSWDGRARQLALSFGLAIENLTYQHRLLSARPVGPLTLLLDGQVVIDPERIATTNLTIRPNGLPIEVKGELSRDGARPSKLALALPETECATLLAALPPGFAPRLSGMPLAGTVSARFAIAGRLDEISADDLELDVAFGCHTTAEAPLGDVARLGKLGTPPPLVGSQEALLPAKFAPLAVVPGPLIRALTEAEDTHFFQHHGFDVPMLRRALAHDLQKRRLERGASTLSQQLIKNLYLSTERTLERKLEEAFLTWRLESTTEKGRILELYLNLVEFGPNLRGIAAASRHYFNVATSELTLDQSAQIVTLLPAPSRGRDEKWHERYSQLATRLGIKTQKSD